jgi:hypothetical protein
MKKRKFKRYDEGGMTEEDAKKKGLEASKDEKVGFFERLRMGNIDDPRSEAYKRFGAGRGRTASAPAAPITPAPVVERSFNTPERIETSGFEGMGGMKPRMPVGLQSAVEGAGVGEATQNLPVAKEVEKKTVVTPRKKVTETTKKVSKPTPKKSAPDESAAETARLARQAKSAEKPKSKLEDTGKSSRLKALVDTFKRAGQSYDNPFAKRFKSGGSVSSASSRADGAAKRGKTKCKVY